MIKFYSLLRDVFYLCVGPFNEDIHMDVIDSKRIADTQHAYTKKKLNYV